jgi:hypothetical protein
LSKRLTEWIILRDAKVMDNNLLPEPYLFLEDDDTERLTRAMNILAIEKGYGVVNAFTWSGLPWVVCMEKKEEKKITLDCLKILAAK